MAWQKMGNTHSCPLYSALLENIAAGKPISTGKKWIAFLENDI